MRRLAIDHGRRVRFAAERCNDLFKFSHDLCGYERPIIDYPGQTDFAEAKRHNLRALADQLSQTIVQPGETFSIWRLAGKPSSQSGYVKAAALHNRRLTYDVGGSTCLMSTVLYNVALLGGMEISERHCHSVDIYGDSRYFELGRDASIEFGYLDLRFRNPHSYPVLLMAKVEEDRVKGSLRASVPGDFTVDIFMGDPVISVAQQRYVFDKGLAPHEHRILEMAADGVQVTGRRVIAFADGRQIDEALPGSLHHPIDGLVAVGSLESRLSST